MRTSKKVDFENNATVCKYVVPRGYPETAASNQVIEVDEAKINDAGAIVYYAAVDQRMIKYTPPLQGHLGLLELEKP